VESPDSAAVFISVPVARRLILLKLIAGRPRDLGDIDGVRFMHGELDVEYMRGWARQFDVEKELDAILARPPI
jgi:hypothetical protein